MEGSEISQDIYYSLINPDGTLTSWTYAGQIPEPRYGHGFLEYNGYFYTVGGQNDISGIFSTIHKQKILDNGAVGLSEDVYDMPLGITRAGFLRIGPKLVLIGGVTQLGITNKVYYADIESDGSLSSWYTSSNSLPVPLCCGAVAENNNYIYFTGGHDGANYFDTVFYSKIDLSAPPPSISSDLPVTLLKQTSPPWESQEYDKANIWSPQNSTINRWGCALTSAAMVFNYHGLVKITDTIALDPGSLNTWLNSQPDGYIGNGLINWLALSRLSKQIKNTNPLFTHDALEYKRVRGVNNEQLDADLAAGNPDILEVPGHFVVSKGKNASTYLIHDPYYNRINLNDGYNNEYLSLGRFIPSHTDLSYILIVTNPEITIGLDNANGDTVGEEMIQVPIIDPVSGSSSGSSINSLYATQPDSGNYTITLRTTGEHTYTADIYVYDKYGEVKKFSFSGNLNEDKEITLPLLFDKNSVSASSMINLVSFADFRRDISALYEEKRINFVTYLLLNVQVNNVERDYNQAKKSQALNKIDLMEHIITQLSKKDAEDPAKEILLKNFEGLRNYVRR